MQMEVHGRETAWPAASKTMLLPIIITAIGVNGSVWTHDVQTFAAAICLWTVDGLLFPAPRPEALLDRNHLGSPGPSYT